MAYFEVVTNYRTFAIEAAGIGDAIAQALDMLEARRGEYLRGVAATFVATQVAA